MSKRKTPDSPAEFKNYLEKKSRIIGAENIDIDNETALFANNNHPVQTQSKTWHNDLNRLQAQLSLPESVPMSTQITTRHSTQVNPRSTQYTEKSYFSQFLNSSKINSQVNTQAVRAEWLRSQAIVNNLSCLAQPSMILDESSVDDLTTSFENKNDEDIIGLTPKICHVLTTQRGLKSLYPWQKRCLNQPNVKHFKSLCYQVPTGGGKSLIAEILILKQIFQRSKNAVLILPYVSLVQEKVASFSMLGTKLDFLVEEYAAGKGVLPPIKRRKNNTLYICTIEKGNALIDSMMFEENRLQEIGVVVIDEIHMLYEVGRRGGTLEALVSKVKLYESEIQIVGMSATIPNMTELSDFLQSSKFENQERPVDLQHYVRDGNSIYEVRVDAKKKQIQFPYSRKAPEGARHDADGVMDLVYEVVRNEPKNVIVFCSSKRQCESLATTYAKSMISLNKSVDTESVDFDQSQLDLATQHAFAMLRDDAFGQLCPVLRQCVPAKCAYHHAGLTPDERRTIEQMYSNGKLNVLFATSTLAAGVNLGADRVIVRSPKMGITMLDPSKYRQMAGRAGRAGINKFGECVLIIPKFEKNYLLRAEKDKPAWEVNNAGFSDATKIDPYVASFTKRMVYDCLPTGESQLEHVFTEFLLSSIVGGIIVDLKTCLRALNGTLWGRTSGSIEETLKDIIERLDMMEKQGLIHITKSKDADNPNNREVFISRLGDACVRSGMTPDQVLHTIARIRGTLHPIYLTSVLSLIFLIIDEEVANRFIGYKQKHRDGRAELLNSYANAVDRLSPTEKDILKQTFGVSPHSISTKAFGMSSLGMGNAFTIANTSDALTGKTVFVKPTLRNVGPDAHKNPNGHQTIFPDDALDEVPDSAPSSPMISSYKNLEKVRSMLLEAAKSIPKKPVFDNEELDRRLIACLAIYECRIKQKGVQFIADRYKVTRGDVQQLCTAASTGCGTLAKFCEIIHKGDQAASLLRDKRLSKHQTAYKENDEMSVIVQASHTLWILAPLLRNLTSTLRYGALGDLVELLDIPSVGMGRAKQLQRAGFTSLEKLANASCDQVVGKCGPFLSRRVAMKILSAARNKIKDRLNIIEESYMNIQNGSKFQTFDINQ